MSEFFKDIDVVKYEGPESKNPLSFRFYNPDEMVGDKSMKEHLKFSVAFWHTINMEGTDPFGQGTMKRPWKEFSDPLDRSFAKVDAMFEFCQKLGVEYFTFHDRDVADEGKTLRETNRMLDKVVDRIKERMKETGIKLLWGTANLFAHPRYVHGAATSPNPEVFAYAAAQV
ncbi:MAG TPA: xylose isomerase, partial [Thermotogales bacterium]|nr:xylose isomerase [Thermotogales bacterium]